jgi:hypothetical protein
MPLSQFYYTSVNPVHNAPRLSVTGPGIQADRAWHGGWGRERSVTDRPGPALPDFDRPGPAWGVGEGEVCYKQTRPGTPRFRPDPALHSRIWTDQARRGGWGREKSVTDRPGPIFRSPIASPGSPFPHPPKRPSQTDNCCFNI